MLLSILLVVATSLDAFGASFAYGAVRIKIKTGGAVVISLIGSAFLGLALGGASWISKWIPGSVAKWLSFVLLMGMGLESIFQNSIKGYLKKREKRRKKFKFTFANIGFILDIYLDETKADADQSKTLSVRESVYLGVVLSLDSIVSGLGCGLSGGSVIPVMGMAALAHLIAVMAGCKLGQKAADFMRFDLSWMSGLILILLGIANVI